MLAAAKAKMQELLEGIAKLNAYLQEKEEERKRMEEDINQCLARMDRANRSPLHHHCWLCSTNFFFGSSGKSSVSDFYWLKTPPAPSIAPWCKVHGISFERFRSSARQLTRYRAPPMLVTPA